VRIGLVIMPTDYGADPRDLAKAIEDRGFESLFFPEHTHIPWSRTSPFPLQTDLPRAYWHNLDPFTVMGATISVTDRLRFGTSICLVAQRDPIVTAKALATLDHLSNGRIELGVGAGWNVEEMRHHGVDPDRRWSFVREHVQAMRSIWRDDDASFHGDFVSFSGIASWPKPVQPGGVPVLIGGDSRHTASRIATYGDGWIPVLDRDVEPLIARIREVEAELVERGHALSPVTVAFGYGRAATSEEVEQLATAGVSRILLAVEPASYADSVTAIDAHAATVADWLKHPVASGRRPILSSWRNSG